jgi:RNA polymerase sigma-70 factor, ECF subfamily
MSRNLFIEKLLNGDSQALKAFVEENQNPVFRTCLAYLQDEHDAADLTQEVFIKALSKLNQFKGEAKLSTWLLRIAINMSLNYLRDNKKRLSKLNISAASNLESPVTRNNPEIKKILRTAIYKLPEEQRRVFILNYHLDLSYKEISETTGYSISSIESLLFRARKKLRELLLDFYDEINS